MICEEGSCKADSECPNWDAWDCGCEDGKVWYSGIAWYECSDGTFDGEGCHGSKPCPSGKCKKDVTCDSAGEVICWSQIIEALCETEVEPPIDVVSPEATAEPIPEVVEPPDVPPDSTEN